VRLEDEKFHLIGTRTRDLPACSIVPQPTTLPRAPCGGVHGLYYVVFVKNRGCHVLCNYVVRDVCCV
jgi:hypothetical protein